MKARSPVKHPKSQGMEPSSRALRAASTWHFPSSTIPLGLVDAVGCVRLYWALILVKQKYDK